MCAEPSCAGDVPLQGWGWGYSPARAPCSPQELQPWSRGAIVVRQALAGASRFSHGRSQGRSGASNHSRGSERSRSSLRLPTLQEDAEYSLCAGAGLVQRAALAAIAPSPARGGGTLSI